MQSIVLAFALLDFGTTLRVTDGATTWIYDSTTKQYTKTSAGERIHVLGMLPADWLSRAACSPRPSPILCTTRRPISCPTAVISFSRRMVEFSSVNWEERHHVPWCRRLLRLFALGTFAAIPYRDSLEDRGADHRHQELAAETVTAEGAQ